MKLNCFTIIFTSILVVTSQAFDRKPYFMNGWQWTIPENAPVGSRPRMSFTKEVVTLNAYDPENGQLTYGVKDKLGQKYFTVDKRSGVVKIRHPFDREIGSSYKMKFFVSDGTNEAEAVATIEVTDVNDNSPTFDHYPYTAVVAENTLPRTVILTINATDPDKEYGGIVKYYIDTNYDIPFHLDPNRGTISVNKRLDYEEITSYQFKVLAMDQDRTNQLTSIVPVIIDIQDVQDTDPVFHDLPYDRSIPENSLQGTEVVRLSATDGDLSRPNDIIYSIRSGNEDGIFLLDSSLGNLRIATRSLDRESEDVETVYTLTVRATEVDTRAFSETTFTVTITDEDDESPQWSRRRYKVSVPEDTPAGTQIASLRVQDRDEGINSEMTISVDLRHQGSFSVTPALIRGIADVSLILMKPLDFEDGSRVHMQVFANETLDSSHSAVAEVIIEIVNVNDNAPEFQRPLYIVSVPENTSINSVVAKVKALDKDEGEFGEVRYTNSDVTGTFGMDPFTGDIHLLKKLDREDVYKYGIIVSASDKGVPPFSATTSVTIHVTDVNDNAPQFDLASYTAYVTENEIRLKPIATVRASDADSPPNNDITYGLIESSFSDHFSVATSPEGLGLVYLKTPLDFEATEDGIIKLEIVAVDSGTPSSNSTVPLVVTVADVNDNKPAFLEDSTLNISIDENLGGGVKIGQLYSKDGDAGDNGVIRYYIDEGRKEFEKIFRLDELSGEVTVKPGSSPDHETSPFYEVTVVAEDKGNPPLTARASMAISVLDVNDNPPEFAQEKYTATFREGTTSPRLLSITATDADEGENATIRYHLTEGEYEGTFAVDPVSGDIIAIRPLDYESTSGLYSLVVSATDQAEDLELRLSSTCQVEIHVTDVNDNTPVFEAAGKQPVEYDITEGVEGPRVARLYATDADSGKNGFITYSICSGNDKGLFSISHSEGELRVTAGRELDRESADSHQLTICATDAGSRPRDAKLSVTIRVIDVNDNAPTFIELRSPVNISEDSRASSVLTRVSATDPDLGHETEDSERAEVPFPVTYSITAGNDNGAFLINKWTGEIKLAKTLDWETQSSYDLEITAKDNPKSPDDSRATTKILKVFVTDVNDESPRFVGSTPYHGRVFENSVPGTAVEIQGDPVLAVDADEGENGVVTYSIVNDDLSFINNVPKHGKSFFAINPKTAEITVQALLDRETLASDVVTLVVRASNNELWHSDVTVLVRIEDVNDNKPRFRSERIRVQVKEDILPGQEITSVLATDSDIGDNKKLTYRIKSGAYDTFTIMPDTGVIKLAPGEFLDRETTPTYTLVVVAYDNGVVTQQSSSCVVTIHLDDVNDSRPKFQTVWQEVQIKENSPPGSAVAQVDATDPDRHPQLEYSVESVTALDTEGRPVVPGARSRSSRRQLKSDYDVIKSWFTLNATTGDIVVSDVAKKANSVDRELCSEVELKISVRDLTSVDEENAVSLQPATVKVTIEDENDNSPRFIISAIDGDATMVDGDLIIDITEEAAIGTELLTVKAVDDDKGANAKVVYDIIEGPKVQMRDQDSGTIIVASRIDRESLPHYGPNAWVNMTVLARDLGIPESRSAKLKVRMRVRDINDNRPAFERRRYKVSLLENTTVGSEVTKVKAKDADSSAFGDLIYTLRGGKDKFGIHPVTGSVRLLRPLDREETSKYSLTVTATDNERGAENDRRQADVEVIIHVLDVNDCRPVFTEPKSPRTYSVQETAQPGSFVAVVSAKDEDDGGSTDISYSLQPNSISKYFDIQESTGHITIRRKLASLPRSIHSPKLDVIATDRGGLSSNMTIYLDIVDANNHAPMFEEPRKEEISIFEEEPAGLLVGHVLATDADSGLNGIVRYSFCDGKGSDSFYIDEVTGRIITARRLDREKISKYTLSICASDLGQPSSSSHASLTIKLLDRNDNEAEFPRSEDAGNGEGAWQSLRVSEDTKVGESVGMVMRAVDRDLGENARIYYHLVAVKGQGAQEDMFSVDQESRRIFLKRPLDREKVGRYSLIIKASNSGEIQPALPLTERSKDPVEMVKEEDVKKMENETYPANLLMTSGRSLDNVVSIQNPPVVSEESPEPLYDPSQDRSLIQVDVEILDVNDERPSFQKHEYDAAVEANAKPGTEVIRVKAIDLDAGSNSIVTYTIVSTIFHFNDGGEGPVYSVFHLDPRDGIMKTERPVEKYADGYFRLEVEARDSANHRATAMLNIYVVENDKKVKFVINHPPDVMRERKDKFAEVLGNTTKYRVIVDDIQYHTQSDGKRNVAQSDVTVRAFDPKTRKEIESNQVQKKLEENEKILERLFGEYSIREIAPTNGRRQSSRDAQSLRIVVIVMLLLIILLLIAFTVVYFRMQRRYKKEIEDMTNGTLVRHGMKLSSRGGVIAGSNVFAETGTNPIWGDDYYGHLGHKLSEENMEHGFGRAPIPIVRKTHKMSELPEAKPRSRSENDKLKEKSIPRTSTDVWVPRAPKPPITAESLQILMKERARKKRLEKKKDKERTHTEEKVKAAATSVTVAERDGEKDASTTDQSSDCTVLEANVKPKEKKVRKEKRSPLLHHGRHSPELSLHSGGPSDDLIRKESLSLHASEVIDNDDDDSDATATNVTSSPISITSTPQITSSVSSINLISDL